MKIFVTIILLASSAFGQYSRDCLGLMKDADQLSLVGDFFGHQVQMDDDTVRLVVVEQPKPKDENQLDIRWLGCYVGAQSLNEFVDNHTIDIEVKPYATGVIGIGDNFTANLQLIVPTKKNDKLLWRVGIDRRIF